MIDPVAETSKNYTSIEDTYVFTGGGVSEDPSKVYAYGSFIAGRLAGDGIARALLKFKNLPDIGNGSIIYAATMYIWQYEYSADKVSKIPLLAQEIISDWTEKDARWSNQPGVSGDILDYKEVGQVRNGNTITITPIGFDVTRLVRKWYNTGVNRGIMVRSQVEFEENAYARFYSSDYPHLSSNQYPGGIFYYRDVTGLEDYLSFHEQPLGRAGTGYTNDYTGNVIWVHSDAETTGGTATAVIRHVYNSCESAVDNGQGYGWRLSSMQRLEKTAIEKYPYVYTDEDGTRHYFYKDDTDGNKLKDEDGLGLVITVESGKDDRYAMIMETKDKIRYIFARDGSLRFVKDPDENQVAYVYRQINGKKCLDYIEDGTGSRIRIQYGTSGVAERVAAIQDAAGRWTKYGYDNSGNLTEISYPDGRTTTFAYFGLHRLIRVTGTEGYGIKYGYDKDMNVLRVTHIAEFGKEELAGQEMKVSYENGNKTIFEDPGLDGEISQTADNKKTMYHFDTMGRPTDVIDSDGFANSYEYYTSGMKNHKLKKEGSTQKTIYHLLANPLFDSKYSMNKWYAKNITDGEKRTFVTDAGYGGTQSVKIKTEDTKSTEGICQDVTLDAGTYTLSAYLKTEAVSGEKGAGLLIIHADGQTEEGELHITGTTDTTVEDGWERHSMTFILKKSEKITVAAGISQAAGTLWVSGMQLEAGEAANKLNLIMNTGFEQQTGTQPENWEYASAVTGDKLKDDLQRKKCAVLKGRRDAQLYCMQYVHVSGKKDEVYSVSGWMKGYGIPDKKYMIEVKVKGKSGNLKSYTFNCNPNIGDWQFVCGVFRTEEDYQEIQVFIQYDNQLNEILIDGVQLIRDDGESYVYDNEGNLLSAKSAAEKAGFSSNKSGNVTRMGGIDGTAFEYGYDSKDHLIQAVNSEGVRYSFEYKNGRTVADHIEPGRLYYLREKSSGNYMDVEGAYTTAGTKVQMYPFNGSSAQRFRITEQEDGYLRLEPQNAPGTSLDLYGASGTDGTAIDIYTDNGTDAQRWMLKKNEDGSWKIHSKITGEQMAVSNENKSTVSGTPLKNISLSDEKNGQDWYLEKAEDEGQPVGMYAEAGKGIGTVTPGRVYYIREKSSGNYLDVYNGVMEPGAKVHVYPFNGNDAQRWKVLDCEDGYLRLMPEKAPGLSLDIYNASTTEGASVQIYTDNGTGAQRWRLQPLKGGSYQISSKITDNKKGLTDEKQGIADSVLIKNCTLAEENVGQEWYFEPADEGKISDSPVDGQVVSIRARHSGQYIDMMSSNTEEHTSAIQYYHNGRKNQKYRMKACGDGYYYLLPLYVDGMAVSKKTDEDRLVLRKYEEGTEDQMFRFEEVEPGKGTGYVMICKNTGKMAGVKDGSRIKGAEITLTEKGTVQRHQWWILESVSDRMESSMEYTSDGRQIRQITDVRGAQTTFTYDDDNRLLKKVTDPKGTETTYEYDPNTDQMTRVIRKTDQGNREIVYTYDGDKIQSIQRNGMEYGYEYDAYGNQTAVKIAGVRIEQTSYRNKDGVEDKITYATGESIRNVYDFEERLTGQYLVHADGTEEKLYTNTFDNYGNVIVHEDERNGMTYHYQYDLIGRVLGNESSDGMKLMTSYDKKNRVEQSISRLDGKGHQIRYIYGDVGKQQKPGLGYGVELDSTERITYIYDILGRYTSKILSLPNGEKKEIGYTYTPGAEEGTTTALVRSVLQNGVEVFYHYDNAGNITEVLEKTEDHTQPAVHYTYEYDQLNQLIREEDLFAGVMNTYEYNEGGNLLNCKKYSVRDGEQQLLAEDRYEYQGAWTDQMTSFNGEPITYDVMGNPLQYRGMTMTWEKGKDLIKLVKDGNAVQYVYDTDGRRIQKTGPEGTTHYYLNGSAVIAQRTDDGERMDFLYDDKGNVFALEYEGSLYFYRLNLQGDVLGIINSDGKEVVTYSYDSWGRPLTTNDNSGIGLAVKNPFRYRSYYYDEETGFYYLNERYYDPEVKRIISADANINLMMSAEFNGKNLYLYCDNNPILRKDDEGEFWHIIAAGAVSAAIGMGTTIAQNIIDGNDWKDGLVESAVTGFVSGAIAGSGLGLTAQNVAQAAVTVAADGYDLWKKSKTKEGITAYDITFAVMDVAVGVKDGIPKEKDVKEWKDGHRIITQYYDSVDNLKRGKKGGKRGVIEKRREKVKKNRKNAVRYSVKRTSPSGLPNAYAVAKYVIQKRGKKYYKKFKKWLRKFK